MNDRELLELAAKAAGMIPKEFAVSKDYMDGVLDVWRPLIDDGDALRLAVELSIYVGPKSADAWRNGKETVNVFEDMDDPYAATRRAIVRAAAALGKEMP
jgi:hypothetical protein